MNRTANASCPCCDYMATAAYARSNPSKLCPNCLRVKMKNFEEGSYKAEDRNGRRSVRIAADDDSPAFFQTPQQEGISRFDSC